MKSSANELSSSYELGDALTHEQPKKVSRSTNAVNRTWSDVDPFTLVVARQQCQQEEQSVSSITRSIWKKHGLRGLYRGVVVSTMGTVASECLYFVVIEKAKESLPFRNKEYRDFGAGLAADGLSGPLYVPFAVVSQRQMVGEAAFAEGASARSYKGTAIVRDIVQREGWRAMFRGTAISLAMMPVSGCWWVVYEQLKGRAYAALGPPSQLEVNQKNMSEGQYSIALTLSSPSQATSKPASLTSHRALMSASPPSHPPIHIADVQEAAHGATSKGQSPSWSSMFASKTDNPLINAAVGAVTGGIISCVLNPLFVVRTRLQVLDTPGAHHEVFKPRTRWRAVAVAKDVYAREGLRGFARGLRVNVVMGIGGSMLFGTFYEGAKRIADTSEV